MAREMGWIGMSEIWMAVLNEDAFTGRQDENPQPQVPP